MHLRLLAPGFMICLVYSDHRMKYFATQSGWPGDAADHW
jgi:hypothetical protein